jgi:hypothetical protein
MTRKYPALPEKFRTKLIYKEVIEIEVTEAGLFSFAGAPKDYESFAKAYDAVYEVFPNSLPGFNAEEISTRFPERYSGSFGTIVSEPENRMFFSYSQKSRDSLWNLDSEYGYFLKKIAKPYLKNPKSFYASYNFLQSHPLLWKLSGDPVKNGTLFWETNEGLADAWHTVYKDKKGKVFHLFEIGEPMEEELSIREEIITLPNRISSHDIELDSGGHTYEDAIINLAKRVNKLYELNGEPR